MWNIALWLGVHTIISFTAARWWLRPLLLAFDRKYRLKPCKESDFYFFCWTWSVVLVLVTLYWTWQGFLRHVFRPMYRAVLPPPIKAVHSTENDKDPDGPLLRN